MKKAQKGFTLVELIVVIAIIGILAAILVPSMMGYVKKSKLKSANTNAKLVYTTINGEISSLMSDGKQSEITNGCKQPVAISTLDTGDVLDKAVYKAMSDNGSGSGFASWDVTNKAVVWAQWADSSDATELIGQYPDPATNPEFTAVFGTKFTGK